MMSVPLAHRLPITCCSNSKQNSIKLEQIRKNRHNHAKQLHKTLDRLSELTKTSTVPRYIHSNIQNSIQDISLLSQAIHILDVNIEILENHPESFPKKR